MARYHVFLQIPSPKWAIPPAALESAARASATALSAPPLVFAWLDSIFSGTGTIPVLLFGVDRDAGTAKMYVEDYRGDLLPIELGENARSVDDVLAPVDHGLSTGGQMRMLSLDWRVGGDDDAVALRQYLLVENLASERFAVVGDEALAGALSAVAARYGAMTEDIAVTSAFSPSNLPGKSLPRAEEVRGKVGLKPAAGVDASTFDGVLRAAGVDAASAARWAAASEGIDHGISNVQAGRGFVTFYRHPDSFGNADPLVHGPLLSRAQRRLSGDGTVVSYTGINRGTGEVATTQEKMLEIATIHETLINSFCPALEDGSFEAALQDHTAFLGVTLDVEATKGTIAGPGTLYTILDVGDVPPTPKPTLQPTAAPIPQPTAEPTAAPTSAPTPTPAAQPTAEPTAKPTPVPTAKPTGEPSPAPTAEHTAEPTPQPTSQLTCPPGSFDNLEGVPGGAPVCETCDRALFGDCSDCECDDFRIDPRIEANCKAACDLPTPKPTPGPTPTPTTYPVQERTMEVPCISSEDEVKVMQWIQAKMARENIPFCWKESYGRGVGTIPGRVPDCPPDHTNTGLTCFDDYGAPSKVADCPSGYTNMGATCHRFSDDIYAPSKVADCPSGYTNMGATCHRPVDDFSAPSKVADCPSGYTNMGLTCHKPLQTYWKPFGHCTTLYKKYPCSNYGRRGWVDTGCTCTSGGDSLGADRMSCPSGYFGGGNFLTEGRCYKECPSGYTNTGEFCHRQCGNQNFTARSC